MTDGFIDLFTNDNPEGNRPHQKGYIKLGGVKYEFACWPNKNGKPGVYSGKVKLAQDDGNRGGTQRSYAQPTADGRGGEGAPF